MQRKDRQETQQADRPDQPQGSRAPHHGVDSHELNGESINSEQAPQAPPAAPECIFIDKEVAELRMVSGLEWDELGRIFGVSAQRVLFWVSGQRINATTAQLVTQVLDVAWHADRGTALSTRDALHDASKGTSPFELLVERRFDDARETLGPAQQARYPIFNESTEETESVLPEPIPPHILANALEDSIHKEVGRTRVVQSVRKKRRGDT